MLTVKVGLHIKLIELYNVRFKIFHIKIYTFY